MNEDLESEILKRAREWAKPQWSELRRAVIDRYLEELQRLLGRHAGHLEIKEAWSPPSEEPPAFLVDLRAAQLRRAVVNRAMEDSRKDAPST